MFSSCAGTGGGGYLSTPFDSGSIIFGGYNEVPAGIRSALAAWDERLKNQHDADLANYYLHHGREDLAKKLMEINRTLAKIVVLPQSTVKALALIGLLFGQAVEDQVRFQVIAKLTGLAQHLNAFQYNPSNRSFTLDLKATAKDFLANSPYFAGPGLSLLHLDVGSVDFRSYTDLTGGMSLQVVVGNDLSRSYADFDRFNPYQDLYSLIRHNLPIIAHRIFK
jgi:hypothetical protein